MTEIIMSKALEKGATQQSTDYSKIKETKLTETDNKLTALDQEISNYEKLSESMDDKLHRLEERFEAEKYEAKLYKDYPSRLNIIDQADKLFEDVDGYIETRNLTLSSNDNKSRGHFGEIIRGIRAEKARYTVEAFGKYVNNRETDIDLFLKDKSSGKEVWLENKEVHSGITNDNEFKNKIDKMSNALEYGVMDAKNYLIKPDKAVFMNSGSISENAKLYAKEKNIEIFDNVKSNKQAEEILRKIRSV
jgi:hypothetical protein